MESDPLNAFDNAFVTTYANGRFVVGGSYGKMAYSADGITWTAVADTKFGSGSMNTIRAITYGNGRFVIGGYDGKAAYSADGITWTLVSDSKFGTSRIYGITYANGRFVAVGTDGKIAYCNY
jgi:hypothetical protein